MPEVTNFVEVARGASGYQKKEFAEFLEVDPQTYRKIESDPDNMTLGMVKSLLPKLNRYSRQILQESINEIFLSCK